MTDATDIVARLRRAYAISLDDDRGQAYLCDEAADTIESLRASLDEMKADKLARSKIDPTTRLHNLCDHLAEHRRESPYDEQSWHLQDEAYKEKCAELAALRAENDALRRDAERWRWLREHGAWFKPPVWTSALDAAIEACMADTAALANRTADKLEG